MAAAADKLDGEAPLGLRERIAQGSARRTVVKEAVRQLKESSSIGDTEGARSAL